MNKLTTISSEIIKFICLVGIFFVWLNFYVRKPLESLILAVLISIFIDLILHLFLTKKQAKYQVKNKELKDIALKSQILIYSNENFVLDFFEKILKIKFPALKKNSNYFYMDCTDSKTYFFPFYSKFSLSKDDLVKIINQIPNINLEKDKLIIFAVSYAQDINIVLNSFSKNTIILFDEVSTYKKLFQKLNFFPENKNLNLNPKSLKPSKQELLSIAFNRQKSKHYLFSGIILLFFSIFANYDLYYVIFSSLLFILAIFSRYNYKFNKKEEELFD